MLLSANYTFCCTDTHQGCCTESLNSHCHPRTEIEGCLCYSCSHVLGLIEGEADKLDMSQDAQLTDPSRGPQFDTKFNDAEYERFLLWLKTPKESREQQLPLAPPATDKPDPK